MSNSDGDEEFYESLDRVLSSSCSSTSASDDDEDYSYLQQHSRRSCPSPPSNSTDVWLSEPASVEERRQRLFHQMGIGCDPELDWVKPDDEGSGVGREREMGRTASYDGLCPRPDPGRAASTAGVFARSRSDSSVKPRFLSRQHASVIGKPPLVGRLRTSLGGELEALDGDGRGSGEDAKSCTIKDLDNGKEFVVREIQEDGMRNKVREVGSERQLSMEEFDTCFGSSPIVQELMRRQNVEEIEKGSGVSSDRSKDGAESNGGGRSKRRSSWLKSLKNVVSAGNRQDRLSSEEKDTSSEKGGRRSSSATDDSQEAQDAPQSPLHGPERIKVRQYGKSLKELTGLFLTQEIQAHSGSIWTIKLSLNGRYLASAGEDYVVHVWQVSGYDRKLEILADRAGEENGDANFLAVTPTNVSPEEMLVMPYMEASQWDRKRREKGSGVGKYVSSDHMMVPEHIFALSERPVCSFIGHLDDVLDLSWSKSQYLLSSSMDKTVRLWHMSSSSCLKIFSHSDYVTCIQFNPFDDRYFISGSLDAKVRLWSIPDRQVVDWNDLREIITAACYTPDGQGALVGSNEGNCYLFDTSDNKLLQKSQVDLQNKKKKPSHKKITGFQFTPGCSWEALITSADSRIRVMDGNKITQKFKGFRNTSSQISASPTADGKYVICASEDSHVYLWRCDTGMRPSRSNSVINVSQSYEYFLCQGVTVAIPWPNAGLSSEEIFMPLDCKEENPNCISNPDDNSGNLVQAGSKYSLLSPAYRCVDLDTSTLTKEKLCSPSGKHSRHSSGDLFNGGSNGHAWGMVIVTASLEGVIRIYQNYGLPVRV